MPNVECDARSYYLINSYEPLIQSRKAILNSHLIHNVLFSGECISSDNSDTAAYIP